MNTGWFLYICLAFGEQSPYPVELVEVCTDTTLCEKKAVLNMKFDCSELLHLVLPYPEFWCTCSWIWQKGKGRLNQGKCYICKYLWESVLSLSSSYNYAAKNGPCIHKVMSETKTQAKFKTTKDSFIHITELSGSEGAVKVQK